MEERALDQQSWVALLPRGAGVALANIVRQRDDTPIGIIRALRAAGWTLAVEGEQLKVRCSGNWKLTDEQRDAIRRHKGGIMLLLTPKPRMEGTGEWEDEWRVEKDMLMRRAACCWKPEDRQTFQELIDTELHSLDDWMALGQRIKMFEIELDRRGDLPPTECLAC